MTKLKLYGALLLIIMILIVVFQNTQPVETRFLFITFIMPRAALLTITFLIGTAAGLLLALPLSKRKNKKS